MDKYSKFDNIYFLEDPIPNYEFLSKLNNKKQIIVAHHTSAIVECAFKKFKCITSRPFWSSEFKITNTFSNKKDYFRLLNLPFQKLIYPNFNDLLNASYQFFLNPYAMFGNKHIRSGIKKYLNFTKIFKFG